jgi:hypothetical protein
MNAHIRKGFVFVLVLPTKSVQNGALGCMWHELATPVCAINMDFSALGLIRAQVIKESLHQAEDFS